MEEVQQRRTSSRLTRPSVLTSGALAVPGVLLAVYLWLLLYAILAVPLWIAFVAAGGTLVAYALAMVGLARRSGHAVTSATDFGSGDIVAANDRVVLTPLVNVAALRLRFVLSMSLALLAGWMIVETVSFPAGGQRWISFACAVALTIVGTAMYVLYARRRPQDKQSLVVPAAGIRFAVWQALGAVFAALGAWQVVETLVFSSASSRWLTFENACACLVFALVALVVHEFSSERVVHVLEVAGWRESPAEDHRHGDVTAIGHSA
jgi:hypothetical protein